jgi:hypothetical protein
MKKIIMEVTLPLLFKTQKEVDNLYESGEYQKKETEDDVMYLVKEE